MRVDMGAGKIPGRARGRGRATYHGAPPLDLASTRLPMKLPLLTLLLVAAPSTSTALAQSVPLVRSAAAADSAETTATAPGTTAHAGISSWMDRVRVEPGVDLVAVSTRTPLGLSAAVTVHNPTAAPVSGAVALRYAYYAAGDFGTWGASDGTGQVGISLPVTDLAPGATVTLPTWSLDRPFVTDHGPMSSAGGFWADVYGGCTGPGAIAYGVSASVELVGVFPSVLDVTACTLRAEVEGELTLTLDLGPAPGAAPTCVPLPNSTGQTATLEAFGSTHTAPPSAFALVAAGMPPGTFAAAFLATGGGSSVVLGGLNCLGGARLAVTPPRTVDAGGGARFDLGLPTSAAGTTVHAQCFFRDTTGLGTTGALALPLL